MLRYLTAIACCFTSGVCFAGHWSATTSAAALFPPSTNTGVEFDVFLTCNTLNGQVLATWSDSNNTFLPTYSFWDGTSWSGPGVITNVNSRVDIDVITCFNSKSGQFLATWGDYTNLVPYYSIYNGSWSTAVAIPSATLHYGHNVFNVYDPVRNYYWAAWTDNVTGFPVFGYYNGSWNLGTISDTSLSGESVFLATDSAGNILAVWKDSGGFPMYSIYNGTSWSGSVAISNSSTVFSYVEACFDSVTGQFVASWVDGVTFFPTTSFYNGSVWSTATTIPPVAPPSGATGNVSLSFDPTADLLLATWTDNSNIFPTFSFFDGTSWSTPATISPLVTVGLGFDIFNCFNPITNQFFSAWCGTFAPYYSTYGVTPRMPADFIGAQRVNNFGVVKELYNVLRWEGQVNVTSYILYRNGVQIAVLNGQATSYQDHDQPKQNQLYTLIAVNAYGQSPPAQVTVGGQ